MVVYLTTAQYCDWLGCLACTREKTKWSQPYFTFERQLLVEKANRIIELTLAIIIERSGIFDSTDIDHLKPMMSNALCHHRQVQLQIVLKKRKKKKKKGKEKEKKRN